MTRRSIIIVALAACGFCLAGCGGDVQSAQQEAHTGRPLAAAARGTAATPEFTADSLTLDIPIELPAQLYVEHDALVVARSAGTIDSIFAELGDRVSPGQLLAKLESTPLEIALASTEASYDNLVLTAGRARALVKSGSMTIADSQQIASQLQQAEIARRKARYDLDLTHVAAPFAGIVTSRLARPRRFVAVGDTLFRVTEEVPLFARVRVPEPSAQSLRVGGAATIDASSGASVSGRIVHMSPIIDAASGTREAVIELATASTTRSDDPHSASIRALVPGVSVVVRLGRARQRLVAVPRAAVAPDDFVVVVDGGRSSVRAVTIGRDLGQGRVEVVNGLSAGERLARPRSPR